MISVIMLEALPVIVIRNHNFYNAPPEPSIY